VGLELYVSRAPFIRNEIYICHRIILKLRIPEEGHAFMDKKCRFHPKLGVAPGLLQNAE